MVSQNYVYILDSH